MTYRFAIVIEKDENGYFGYVPELQGCYTQGETYEETYANLQNAIELHVRDRIESGEPVPKIESVSLSTVEMAI